TATGWATTRGTGACRTGTARLATKGLAGGTPPLWAIPKGLACWTATLRTITKGLTRRTTTLGAITKGLACRAAALRTITEGFSGRTAALRTVTHWTGIAAGRTLAERLVGTRATIGA